MAVYLRYGHTWYLRLCINGQRIHQAIPEASTRKEAEKVEAIIKAQLLQGKYELAKKNDDITFDRLIDEFLEYAKGSKISWKTEMCRVKALSAFFGKKKLKEINPMLIERYRSSRKKHRKKNGKPLTNSSINRETSILRKMLNIAVDNGWIDSNPCLAKKVKPLREDNRRERYLEPDEENLLLEACEGDYAYLKSLVIFALHTGTRKSEMLNLKWENVNLTKKYITITKTKTNKDRIIPLSNTLLKELKKLYANRKPEYEYVFTNPDTGTRYKDIKRGFATILKRADIKGFRWHDFRHSAATRMVAAGIDLIVVQEILGHSCITTTMRYSHPTPERKIKAIDALDNFGKKSNEKVIALK